MKRERLPRHLNHFRLLSLAMRSIAGLIGLLLLTSGSAFGQYCADAINLSDYYEHITRVRFGDIDNVSGRSNNSKGYSDYTAMETVVTPGETYQIAISLGDSYASDYVFVFIDWDQNGLLDDPGEVYEVVTYLPETDPGPHTYDITVPENAVFGAARMRVVLQYWESDANPCATSGDGEVEDYTVIVGTPPACPRPAGLVATGVTTSSIDLTWESSGSNFQLKWGVAGFEVESAGTLVGGLTTTTYTLAGLTEGVPYDVYVRRDCGVDGYSDWTGPLTVTPALTAVVTYMEGDISTAYAYEPDPTTTNFCELEPTLTVEVPTGYQLSGLTVAYDMVAHNYAWKSEQVSMLYSPTLGVGEETVTHGTSDAEGTHHYSRPVDFASGATGEVTFVLRAWRTWEGGGGLCNAYYNYVPNGTWKLIPTFERLATCLSPAELAITDVGRTSATASWSSGESFGGTFDYYYATASTAPHAATTPTGNTANTTLDLPGLDMGATYYFWVRSNCGDGEAGNWVGTSFTTGQPWTEKFAVNYELPDGWQTVSSYWSVGREQSLLDAEGYFIYSGLSRGEHAAFATHEIGPIVPGDVLAFVHRNGYYDKPYHPAPAGLLEMTVGISIDGGNTFQDVTSFANDGSTGWQLFTFGLGDYAGQTIRVRIGISNLSIDYADYDVGFDDFYVGPSQCPRPLNPSAAAITPTSAVISWSEPAGLPEGGYQYYYAESAVPPTAATEPSGAASSASASLTGLSSGEQYHFWVRTVCEEGTYGVWSMAGSFTTELELPSPWSENFDAAASVPQGWEAPDWQVGKGSDILNPEGNIIYASLFNGASYRSQTFSTPNIHVEERDVLSFQYGVHDDLPFGNPAEGRFTVSVSDDYGKHYTELGTVTFNSTTTWRPYSYELDDYVGKNIKIRVVAEYVSGGYQIGFDFFHVGPPPGCPVIGTVSAVDIGLTTAVVEWEDAGSDYEYYLVDSNTPPAEYLGTYVRTSDTQVHFTDLQESTTYYFWVRTSCGDESYSEWGPLAVFTTQTQVSTPWNEGFITTDTPQGWEISGWEIDIHGFFGEVDGHVIYKHLYYNPDITLRTFTTLHVGDIQLGGQLSFRYLAVNYDGIPPDAGSGDFTIAVSADFGETYMDIETIENNGVEGWQEFTYSLNDYVGETIQVRIVAARSFGDYYLAFDDFYIGPEICKVVSNLAVEGLESGKPTLSWQALDVLPAGGYDFYYANEDTQPDATTDPSGNTVEHSAELTDVVAGRPYYWWVRANCGDGNVGEWSTTGTFTLPLSHDGTGIIYVREDGMGNGASWDEATAQLQQAIDIEGVSEVWVAEGTYVAPEESFRMRNHVAIYGGFPAIGSPGMADRHYGLHKTILSGSDQHYVVYNVFDEVSPLTRSAVLDGFVVEKGKSGIYNIHASPTLVNLVIRGNDAGDDGYGGGIFNANASNPLLTNSIVANNKASIGGGIYNILSSPILTNVTITGNDAPSGGSAMANAESSFPLIRNSIIYGNENEPGYGAFIYNHDNTATYAESIPSYAYSVVEGSGGSNNWQDFLLTIGTDGGHNVDIDPQFNNPDAGGYTLKSTSPVIDKGNSDLYAAGLEIDLSGITKDVAGNSRFYDGGRVDMGAHEYQGESFAVRPDGRGIIYVKTVAQGTGRGDSWENAASDLQLAIGTEGVQQVWVASGTYIAPEQGFTMKNGVAIYGGFSNEGTPVMSERNWLTNKTILSGEGVHRVINNVFNADYPLLNTAVLDGFTITAGNAADAGAGILNLQASPTLVNLTIHTNNAVLGGGIGNIDQSSPILKNVLIYGNGAEYGAGIFNTGDSNPKLTNVTISGNTGGPGSLWKGIYHEGDPMAIHNTIIWGNGNGSSAANMHGELATPSSHNIIQGHGPIHQGNVNPLLLHTGNPNHDRYLHLAPNSPAVDAGSNVQYTASGGNLAIDKDAAAGARLYGGQIDLGAFENLTARVVSVDVPASKTYKIGDQLVFTVNWTESVDVDENATAYIPITLGDEEKRAIYTDSDGSWLTFSYTIAEGDVDPDGVDLGDVIVADGSTLTYGPDAEIALLGLHGSGATDEVVVDGKRPTLLGVDIKSSNPVVTLARPGDELTLTFSADEAIGVPSVTIAGKPATVGALDGEIPNSWQAHYTMTVDDEEGTVAFTIDYEDVAGNAGSTVETATDEGIVTFDKTAPETPSSLAIERADGELVISWDGNTEIDFGRYRLYMGTDENDLSEIVEITDIAISSYAHIDLVNGTAYHYRIAAIDHAGNESDWSGLLSEIPKASQTIAFEVLDGKIYGNEPFLLSATTTSGLMVLFESSNDEVASIGDDGVTVTIHGAGTVTIAATQPGNTAFEPATAVVHELVIAKAAPVITWATPTAITYGTALDDTQLNAIADVDGQLTYTPAAGTVLDAGTGHPLSVTFTPDDTDNYEPATAEVTIDVLKATPIITWATPTAITYGVALDGMQLNAEADVDGQLTYTPAAGTVLEAGTGHPLSVTFTPDDADNYEPATAEVTIDVFKATPVITWATPTAITYGVALDDMQLNAEADVDGQLTYTPAAGTVLEAGTGHPLSVTFTPDDADNYEPATAEVTIDVLKATPVITWATPTAITYGVALDGMQLNAEADVDGQLTYTPAAGTVLDAGTGHPLSVTFTPDDTDNYEPLTASQIVVVRPRSITLTVEAQSKVYGDNEPQGYAYTLGDGSTLAATDNLGDIISNTSREAGEGVGSYSVVLEFDGAEAVNYDIVFDADNKAFTIKPKPLIISLNATPEIEKIYDGTDYADLSAGNYRLHGVLGDDDVYVSGSASYEQAEAGENIPVQVKDFVLHGEDATHYVVETASAHTTGRIMWGTLEAPTNLSATAGDKQVALSWQAPPDNGQPVMAYVIQFSLDKGQTWVGADRIPATVTQAVVVGLQNNRPYDFRVAAANDADTGEFSENVRGIIPTAPVLDEGKLPDPPIGKAVVITNGDVGTVTLDVVDSEYLRLSNGDFEFKLAALGVNGNRIPISEIDAIIRMIRGTGTSVYVSGSGFELGTVITVYVFSNPQVLGHIDVRPDGSFEGSLLLPDNLEIGKHTIQANGIVAGEGGERSVSLGMVVVTNKTQEIRFDVLGERTYGQEPILLNATSSSGLPVIYNVTDPEGRSTALATLEHGNELHIHGAGDVLVTALQSGNMEYAAAPSVTQPLHISRAVLDVSVADASRAYGADNPEFGLAYSGFVNNDDVSSLTHQPEARTQATPASAPGTYVVAIEGGISDNYRFRYHAATLTITKAHQAINFDVPNKEISRAIGSILLDVNATSGLPVNLEVDNTLAATLAGTTLNIHRLGTVQITAVQAGDSNYLPADPVTVTVRIVDPSASLPIRVHQAVSPNGDGINEWLIIEGIRDYPENRVTIVNRNGTVLWEASGYDNDNVAFRGVSTGQLRLPAGTYFYIVEVKVNGKWEYQKGYFVLRY